MRINPILPLVAAAALAGCISVPPQSEMVAVTSPSRVDIEVGPTDILELHIPAGEVSIAGEDTDTTRATMVIKCPPDSKSCAKWAADARLRAIREGNRVHVGVNKPAKLNAAVKLNVSVPKNSPIKIFMDYGELRAQGLEDHVSVEMKAGDIDIEMPRDAVDEVHLAARFGDASMRVDRRPLEGRRPWLVGAKLDWLEGTGEHDVNVHLRYGDVSVELYP